MAFQFSPTTEWPSINDPVYEPTTVAPVFAEVVSGVPTGSYFAGQASISLVGGDSVKSIISIFKYFSQAQINSVVARDGSIDITAAVQAAINSGESLYFPDGTYFLDPVTVPYSARGANFFGSGYDHSSTNRKTVIKARTAGQAYIFSLANGANGVEFHDMRIDGDNKAARCIDAYYGSFLGIVRCGVYNATEWCVYSKQGLMRIQRCFIQGPGTATGAVHMYSDSAISDSELTGTKCPLRIAAGGNRGTNLWINSGRESCLEISPLDDSTNLVNTEFANLYIGETFGADIEKPIIRIQGTANRTVEQVHFANLHLVCADAPDKINIGIVCDGACDVVINGGGVLGGSPQTTTKQLKNFAVFTNTQGWKISNMTFRNIAKNVIVVGLGGWPFAVNDNEFYDWATQIAAGTDGAAILLSDTSARGRVVDNLFWINGESIVPYPMQGGYGYNIRYDGNLYNYAGYKLWEVFGGGGYGGYQRTGSGPYVAGTANGYADVSPETITSGGKFQADITIAGVVLGDLMRAVSYSKDLKGVRLYGYVNIAGNVKCVFENMTGADVTLEAGVLRVRMERI